MLYTFASAAHGALVSSHADPKEGALLLCIRVLEGQLVQCPVLVDGSHQRV